MFPNNKFLKNTVIRLNISKRENRILFIYLKIVFFFNRKIPNYILCVATLKRGWAFIFANRGTPGMPAQSKKNESERRTSKKNCTAAADRLQTHIGLPHHLKILINIYL